MLEQESILWCIWEVGFCLISSHSHATVVYTPSSLIFPLRKKMEKKSSCRCRNAPSNFRFLPPRFLDAIQHTHQDRILRKRIKISIKPLESNGEWPDSQGFPWIQQKQLRAKKKETSKASVLYQLGSPKAKNFTPFWQSWIHHIDHSTKKQHVIVLVFPGLLSNTYIYIYTLILLVIVCGATSYLSTTTR